MTDWTTLSTYMEYHPEVLWMGLGAFLLLLEVSAIPGIGLLFGGLAAMTLGGLMAFDVISRDISTYLQFAWFFGFTVLWAAILWKPFMKMKKRSPAYHAIIGSTATVMPGGLKKGRSGKVKWSGAPMAARIRPESARDSFAEGDEVWVHELDGSVLVVDADKPAQSSESGV